MLEEILNNEDNKVKFDVLLVGRPQKCILIPDLVLFLCFLSFTFFCPATDEIKLQNL